MVSKAEVLEYCRLNKKEYSSLARMRKIFINYTNTEGLSDAVKSCLDYDLVQKFTKVYEDSGSLSVPKRVTYKPIETGHVNKRVYLKLTKKAYELLDEWNIDSFYDLPRFKKSVLYMMTREKGKRRKMLELE